MKAILTCEDESALKQALEKAEALLTQNPKQTKTNFLTVESALSAPEGATVATLSIPGQYAKEVASKFIEKWQQCRDVLEKIVSRQTDSNVMQEILLKVCVRWSFISALPVGSYCFTAGGKMHHLQLDTV